MPAAAGYSGTPLARKLGIRPGHTLLLADAPEGFAIPGLPDGLLIQHRPDREAPFDTALWFPADRADLTTRLAGLRAAMRPAAGLWIAWPKKASRIPTDLTEDVLREVALPTGLVDTKVCAVDATYSGLRFVVRRELRLT
ncbi:DUF3052 domain-containing protein [Kitasatospora sp. DSM 101779]|uniref:DUF3052 domain-containing protein n=1 Tax=Kitasatospora sp. DSM 101779 TaxID=2853165 RepID=UPI0021DA1709|nr:DUF3052 domain-containing protein [Kitasatospora sp. DSM 101779]MCU7825299.1 DUF3052 domain-containing protein [Kitasatospora sp. DSM 101779]